MRIRHPLTRCFTALAELGKTQTTTASGLDRVSCVLISSAPHVFCRLPRGRAVCMKQAGLAGQLGFGLVGFSNGWCWEMLACFFLFHSPHSPF